MKHPEQMDDYVFYFENSHSLVDQCIDKYNDVYLLNVRKVFTDNKYFGVTFTTYDTVNGVLHRFRCKDRYTFNDQDTIDNVFTFINYFRTQAVNKENTRTKHILDNLIRVKQDFSINADVYFCFDGDTYIHTLIHYENMNFRGLYGTNNYDEYNEFLVDFGSGYYNNTPTQADVESFLERSKQASSNHEVTASTAYSKIIIEHKSQYNNEISDIKRRRRCQKNNQ
jgi:hypothetical protein